MYFSSTSGLDIAYSPNCEKDVLTIFDGPTAASSILFQNCTGPRPLLSSTNQVYVTFKSDDTIVAGGYRILLQCAKLFTAAQGALYDPGGVGDNYGNSQTFRQIIKCGIDQYVAIKFTQLDIVITFGTTCNDNIVLYDGPTSASSKIYGPACGQKMVNELWSGQTTGNFLLVFFSSDSYMNGPGFGLSYTCNAQLTTLPGQTTTPTTTTTTTVSEAYMCFYLLIACYCY